MDDVSDIWDDERSETQLDAYQRLTKQNANTIDLYSTSIPKSRKRVRDDTEKNAQTNETVPLREHFTKIYNDSINRRLAPDSNESEEEEEEEADGEEEKTVHLSDDSSSHKRQKHCHHAYDMRKRGPCVFCEWGNKTLDSIEAPHYDKLVKILDENYGYHDNLEIADELKIYYDKEVYDPTIGMPKLTRAGALEHIEGLHTLNAKIFLGETIRDERQMMISFRDAVWRSDGSYDNKAYANYRKSVDAIFRHYLFPLPKANFNERSNPDDLKKMADYYKIRPKFEQVERKQQTQRRVATL